ncbi:hypothetical protein ACFXDJ_09350 [Streptomyces sp. NPDC059443]|uniref:hypothetical protein n=1 Tax=unclassified Streptomyces TaxID=2593676 RepID=UPI0036AD0C43
MRATFRTAAVAAGAITALALPTAQAFAADAPAPANPSAATDTPKPAEDKPETKPETKPADKPETKPETKREGAGTQQLGDGWYAKVFKHVSNGPTMDLKVTGYEAEIYPAKGALQATLKAFGKADSAKVGEYTFTLSADGKVTTKKDAAKPKPKPVENKVSGISVGGGTMADLTNKAGEGPKAVLKVGPKDAANGTKAGTVMATLTAKSPRAENNGQKFEIVKADSAKPQLKVTLEGQVKHYDFPAVNKGTGTGTGTGTGDKATTPATPAKPVTPKGGVRAGAEGVESSGGEGTLLIAGGAGLAAAGAAGLGFAMLRRHRTES